MGAPFKMKGSPMQRNFGIGSPLSKVGSDSKSTGKPDFIGPQAPIKDVTEEKHPHIDKEQEVHPPKTNKEKPSKSNSGAEGEGSFWENHPIYKNIKAGQQLYKMAKADGAGKVAGDVFKGASQYLPGADTRLSNKIEAIQNAPPASGYGTDYEYKIKNQKIVKVNKAKVNKAKVNKAKVSKAKVKTNIKANIKTPEIKAALPAKMPKLNLSL